MSENLDDTDMTSKRSKKKSSRTTGRKNKGKKSKKEKVTKKKKEIRDLEEYPELEESYENRDDIEECVSHLNEFYKSLTTIDLESLITKTNMNFFENMNPKENVQIDLLLCKIYAKIISSEDFYQNFFSDEDENGEKVPLVLSLIEESIQILDNFSDYFISFEIFKFKENLLKLIKFIYINLRDDITEEEEKNLSQLINDLPGLFF